MKKIECKCDGCKNACKYRPGWFLPNQVNSLLEYFNVKTIKELLKTGKIAIDWWMDDINILILAPNIINNTEIYYPGDPRNCCVFYNNELCDIYKIKPYECSMYSHEDKDDDVKDRHKKIMNKWKATDILEQFRTDVVFGSLSFSDFLMCMGDKIY